MTPEDLLLGFLNSVDVDEGTDEMVDLASWRGWVRGREEYAGLPAPTAAALRQARELRTYLRAVALGTEPPEPAPQIGVVVDLAGGRLTGETVGARVAAAVATLAAEGRLSRVRICAADDCRWGFYDRSRNHSRQWCSMAVCGNRAKVRHHREQAAART
jgi:hypothetical protein